MFVGLNQLGWATEIVAAVLMLIPQTRFLGAAIIVLTFAFIATQIRLGLLCEMVVVAGVLFFQPGKSRSPARARISSRGRPRARPATTRWAGSQPSSRSSSGRTSRFCRSHTSALRRISIADARSRRRLQRLLEVYTNAFGIIVWRVFSVDVVGFFVKIHRAQRSGPGRARARREVGVATRPSLLVRRRGDHGHVAVHHAEVLPEQQRTLSWSAYFATRGPCLTTVTRCSCSSTSAC